MVFGILNTVILALIQDGLQQLRVEKLAAMEQQSNNVI
jgi:hypothetical protein